MCKGRNGSCYRLPTMRVLPLPPPTHTHKHAHVPSQCAIAAVGKPIAIGFLSAARTAAAHPAILMGDILSDLPDVDNFCLRDR
jgi:hypothetical protein